MLPYLIAGAIGFVVGKLFEEDEAPKYADGGLMLGEYNDLIDLAKESDYNDFLDETDELSKYYILYRGMDSWDEWTNDSFMGNFLSHAKEYGEYVDGIIVDDSDSEIIYFDNYTFNQLRKNITNIILPSFPIDFEGHNEYKQDFVEKLKEIYKPYFDEGKLSDAMMYLNYDEDDVINFVFNFVFNSTENFEEYYDKKDKDFLVPLLTYYAKNKGYNIISFYASDFGGSDEFVVNDISKYITLSDIWKSVDGNNPDELFNSFDDYADGGSVLLAPNGKPSNLTPEQYKLVRTDTFKNWFGDWEKDPANASKVVDSNGEPLICYHGTNADFYEFENKIGIRGNQFTGSREVKSDVFFFTDNLEYAEKVSNARLENFRGKKNIIISFLNIKNPLDFSVFDFKTEEKFEEIVGELPHNYFGFNDNLNQWWRLFDNDENDITNRVKEKGYDGVILAEETKIITYLSGKYEYNRTVASIKSFGVFNPNQIKLADGTNTTFDSNNPDIRFDEGGKVLGSDYVIKKQQIDNPYSDIIFSNENAKFVEETISIEKLRQLNGFSEDNDEIEQSVSYFNDNGMDEDYYVSKKLMNKIVDGVKLSPIVVDENYKVLDGSHRLSAYSELYYHYSYDYPFDGKLKIYKRISN